MPNILTKLFRRKKATTSDTATSASPSKQKGRKVKKGKQDIDEDPAKPISPARSDDKGLIDRNYSLTNTSITGRGSNTSAEKDLTHDANRAEQRRPDNSGKFSTHSQAPQASIVKNERVWPMDEPRVQVMSSHDENLDHSNAPASLSPRLSFQQLQQFESQQQRSPPSMNSMSQPMFHMSADLPRQQMNAMDDMNRSDASSSSFNLSTDAEDSEYEQLKRSGKVRVPPPAPAKPSTIDTSVVPASHIAYTKDDERLFASLQAEEDMTQEITSSFKVEQAKTKTLLVPPPTPDDEPGRIQIFPHAQQGDDDLRAWMISPTATQASKENSTKSTSSQQFTFPPSGSSMFASDERRTPSASTSGITPTASTGRNPPGTQRNFTSPKSAASSTDFSSNNDFANFADFSNFGDSNFGDNNFGLNFGATTSRTASSGFGASSDIHQRSGDHRHGSKPTPTLQLKDDDGFGNFGHHSASAIVSPSSGQADNSLSKLLAQAKNKRRPSHNGEIKPYSSASVNSAPAITSQYLRQHHNLRSSYGGYGEREREGSRVSTDTTSVSDIIHSLEATNNSRIKTGPAARQSSRSMGHEGAVTTVRLAKERLREKRQKERDTSGARVVQKSRSSEHSSSENSENEASESWLFDEVTGALGPRGIAADLESLSGRSRNSKNSNGNKSHKSHRSHRSRRSSRHRQKTTSNDSVDSKSSRYSHRSTKSFLSQMSEQSRSVANDLLRLEMQLAMVGSQEHRDDVPARTNGSVGGTSVGGGSRTSRTSRTSRKSLNGHGQRSHGHGHTSQVSTSSSSIARRNKISVMAPPGKLGIILANKADSKGTVVSGVRTSSVLAESISPGDRIIAIDGEDVSRMTVSEITTIMARKADFERSLTVLSTPRHMSSSSESAPRSPTKGSSAVEQFDNSFQQYRR